MGRASVLAVVLLALLAGCGGLAGDDREAAPTLTAAPVPGENAAVADGPNGLYLRADYVVNAHNRTLASESYTLVETLRVGPADNTTFFQRTAIAAAAGDVPKAIDFDRRVDHRGFVGRGTDAWWDGQRTYYRYAFRIGQYSYSVADNPPAPSLRIDERFSDVLGALEVADVRYRRDGTVFVAGPIEDVSTVPRTRFVYSVRNATMSLRVGPNGTVQRMAIGYDANYYDRGTLHVRYTYRVSDVGTTSPSPPEWLSRFDENENKN